MLAGAALGLLVAVVTIVYMASEREATLRYAEREVRTLSLVLAEWMEDGFRAVEQLEVGIADWVRAEGIDTPEEFYSRLATPEAHEHLRVRKAALPRVSRLFLVDANGRNTANTASYPAPSINSIGRDYFDALRDGTGPNTFLSSPSRNQVDGEWSVFVARRLQTPDGRFLGVVAAGLDLSQFEEFFARLALGPGSSVSLIRRDGLLIARHPRLEDRVGMSLAASETFTGLLTLGNSGAWRGPSIIDGAERVFGVQALGAHPLVVVATHSAAAVLAPWRRDLLRRCVVAALIEALIAAGVILANRQARTRASMRRLEATNAAAEALRAVFETGTVGVAEFDAATNRFSRVNRRFCEMTGRTEAELLDGRGPADIVHPDDLEAEPTRWRALDGPDARDAEERYLRPDGTVAWVRLSVAVSARDEDGRPLRCVTLVQDVTESRKAAERVRASEAMLRVGQTVGRIGTFSRDLVSGALSCGPETRVIFGLPEGEGPIPPEVWMASVVPEDRERLADRMREAIARRDPEVACDYRIRTTDGALRHVEMRARYEFDETGVPVGSVGVGIDVTERHEAEERQRASEELLRLGLEVGHIGAYRRDMRQAGAIECNQETRLMHGLPLGEEPIPAEVWAACLVPEDRVRVMAEIELALARHVAEMSFNYSFVHPTTGETRHLEARARYFYDADGKPLSSIGVVIDVTERREAEARIAHMAHHDALTDLPNRVLFRERMDAALVQARRGEGFALLCLDLDRFKEVNDVLGHAAGDVLLRTVAARLKARLREGDTLARLGGDEFAIIQNNVDQSRATTALAGRLIEALSAPFDIDGQQVFIGTSVGIAVAPADGLDRDILLKNADMALYRAKAEGRGRSCFYDAEMDRMVQMRRAVEADLRLALAADEFELHYQPIVGVSSRRVSCLEALVRWNRPGRGLVPPDHFIPMCEETGLIVPLGDWVLAKACRDAVHWSGAPRVAVNLSPVQFASGNLVEAVAAALEESGLDPERLELEITETVMLRDTETTLATLHQLKALGVRIALDDFGTGYSSLSYLQRFPFDKVKIDRSFIRDLDRSRQSNAIVGAVVDLCTGLGMITTAEGVETEGQLAALLHKGCHEAQGWLFSKALPAAEIPGLLASLDTSV